MRIMRYAATSFHGCSSSPEPRLDPRLTHLNADLRQNTSRPVLPQADARTTSKMALPPHSAQRCLPMSRMRPVSRAAVEVASRLAAGALNRKK